jgi:hypothetical protein
MTKHRGKRGDFWSKVDMSQGPDACWPWIGSLGRSGYGQVRVNKKLYKAHRVAWEKTYGPLPFGFEVCHTCDNPPCCNPAHLFKGTHLDNIADMIAKGRNTKGKQHIWSRNHNRAKGEKNGNAKLTKRDIKVIRATYAKGGITQRQIGAQYGVSDVLISLIVRRVAWSHVE